MRRREFITVLGGAAVSWPYAASAQRSAMPVIGFLSATWAATRVDRVAAFRQGLSETGYVEGKSVAIEFRWADTQFWQLRSMADDLVRRQVTVIVAAAASSSAAKAAGSVP